MVEDFKNEGWYWWMYNTLWILQLCGATAFWWLLILTVWLISWTAKRKKWYKQMNQRLSRLVIWLINTIFIRCNHKDSSSQAKIPVSKTKVITSSPSNKLWISVLSFYLGFLLFYFTLKLESLCFRSSVVVHLYCRCCTERISEEVFCICYFCLVSLSLKPSVKMWDC